MRGGRRRIGIAQCHQGPVRRPRQQPDRGGQDQHAGALRADQGPGGIEPLLRQQVVQVVPGHPPRDLRVALPDQLAIGLAQETQPCVDLAAAPALRDDRVQLLFLIDADAHPCAVVEQHVQFDGVVHRLPAVHRVRAAGVVAQHPSQRVVVVGGGVEGQAMLQCRIAQLVADHPGLDPGSTRHRVQFKNPVHVLGKVEDDGRVDTLPGKPGSAAACHHRHTVPAAGGQRGDDVVVVPGDHDADGHHPVDRSVIGVETATGLVEADLAADHADQIPHQPSHGLKPVVVLRAAWLQDRPNRTGTHAAPTHWGWPLFGPDIPRLAPAGHSLNASGFPPRPSPLSPGGRMLVARERRPRPLKRCGKDRAQNSA